MKTASPEGRTFEYFYDDLNNVVKTKNGLGGTETATYDAAGRILTSTSALGGTSTYTYTSMGEVSTVTDPNGNLTTYQYDSMGNVRKIVHDDASEVELVHDGEGRLISRTDENGELVTNSFDGAGRVESVEDAAARETGWTYDAAGRPLVVTKPDGATVSYSYDRVGRVIGIDYSGSTPDVIYTYDAAGRRLTMTDGTGTTTYAYDVHKRLVGVTDGNGNEVSYTYDGAGRIAAVEYPSGYEVTKTYDDDGLLTKITDDLNEEISFAYDGASLLIEIAYPNGVVETITRNSAGSVTKVEVKDSLMTVLASWDYTIMSSGQVGGMSDSLSSLTPSYTYSDRNRITGGSGSGYSYDPVGNITELSSGDSLSYDEVDQLVQRLDGSTVLADYTYDLNGNRVETEVSAASTTYSYDGENRLTSYDPPSGPPTSYTYDGEGLRSTSTKGTQTDEYTWDRSYADAELLSDGDNLYLYGPNGIPLQQVDLITGEVTYLHVDRLGSVRLVTDDTGSSIGQASYGPYGEKIGQDTLPTPFGFAGEYEDETGLIYLRARYYDPVTAQFLTIDPLFAVTHSRYGYAAGDPLSFVDPSGLNPLSSIGGWIGDKANSGASWLGDKASTGASYVSSTASSVYNTVSSGVSTAYTKTENFVNEHKSTVMTVVGVTAVVGAAVTCVVVTAGACAVVVIAAAGVAYTAYSYGTSDECFSLGSFVRDVAIEAIAGKVVRPAKWLKGLATKARSSSKNVSQQAGSKSDTTSGPRCVNSFSRKTLVLMGDGSRKKISAVRKGDVVKAWDPKAGRLKNRKVTALLGSYHSKDWTRLELSNGEKIMATSEHPFWSQSAQSWVPAGSLEVGDHLLDSRGRVIVVLDSLQATLVKRSYNLTIQGLHTYQVGRIGAWVHNCGPNGEYQAAEYHHRGSKGTRTSGKSPAPTNPQYMLDNSVSFSSNTSRRVAADKTTGEYAVFDYTTEGVAHGHVVQWGELTQAQQAALRSAGYSSKKGKILK